MKIINEFCLVKDKKIECVLIKSDNKTSLSPLVLLLVRSHVFVLVHVLAHQR